MAREPWHDERITTLGLLLEARDALAYRLADPDLPQSWLEVLLRLARSDGELRMAELASQVRLSASGLTRLVDRMEAAGLVERRSCPTDRRGWTVSIRPAGADALRRVLPRHLDDVQRLLVEPLGADLQRFEELLRRVRDTAQGAPET